MTNLVLFGPPGSGKGTQSALLIDKYNLIHLSTGDMLRSEIAGETDLGLKAKSIMEQGLLVSDEIVIGMIESQLEKNANASGFIFDGFPRTVPQANALDQLLEKKNMNIQRCVSLVVDFEELKTRLILRGQASGRTDDTEEVIVKRIKEYLDKTSVVSEYYRSQNKLTEINGIGDIQEIFSEICNTIGA